MKTNESSLTTESDCMFVTSDEHVFFDQEKAIRHANKLHDKSIKSLTRQAAEELTTDINTVNTGSELDDFLDELTGN